MEAKLHSLTLRFDGLLVSEGLEHLVGGGQTISTLTNGNVEAQFGDAKLAHRVLSLGGSSGGSFLFGLKKYSINIIEQNTSKIK